MNKMLNCVQSRAYAWDDCLLYWVKRKYLRTLRNPLVNTLVIDLDGCLEPYLPGKVDKFSSGMVFFCGDKNNHCYNENNFCACLTFEPGSLIGRMLEIRMQKSSKDFLVNDEQQKELYQIMVSIYFNKSGYTTVREKLFDFLSSDLPRESYLSTVDDRIANLFIYFNLDHKDELNVDQLADKANLSLSRLRSLFRSEVGMTLGQFRTWVKVRQALKLIMLGNKVSVAGLEAGFCDASHFSHAFKRMLGFRPSDVIAERMNAVPLVCQDFSARREVGQRVDV